MSRARTRAPEASERQRKLEHARAALTREQLDRLTPETLAAYLDEPPELSAPVEPEADPIDSRLAKLDRGRQLERVKQARAEHQGDVAALDALDARRREIRDGIETAEERRDALVEKTKRLAAEALLSGKATPDNAKGRAAVEREGEKIEAGQAALVLAEQQRPALVDAERAAFADLCDQVLDLTGAGVLADLSRARKALAAMAPTLASLIAGDIVRERLIGTRWSFDTTRVRPCSGEIIVRAFVNSVSERLRTEELAETALRTTAERIAKKMLADIQKETEQ